MSQEKAYLRIDAKATDLVKAEDIESAISLVEHSIKLITDTPLAKVIEFISIHPMHYKGVEIRVSIYPRWRPLVFGKRFSNVVSLRKLLSNLSGKSEIEVWLTVVER